MESLLINDNAMNEGGSDDEGLDVGADGFMSRIAEANVDELRRLLLMVHICHILLVVEPACRVDPTFARKLRIVNSLRLVIFQLQSALCSNSSLPRVQRLLGESSTIPTSVIRSGRLCAPRILFALHRGAVRPDMSLAKRVDILQRLTDKFEDQLYAHYRKSRIVTKNP